MQAHIVVTGDSYYTARADRTFFEALPQFGYRVTRTSTNARYAVIGWYIERNGERVGLANSRQDFDSVVSIALNTTPRQLTPNVKAFLRLLQEFTP